MTTSDTLQTPEPIAKAPALSVVVPVKNEVDNVEPLISEIAASLRGDETFEIIYVDDGSDDRTAERLVELTGPYPELRVFRHKTCCGQSVAICTGVENAQAALIATLDGDGQNDPADIPALLKAIRASENIARTMVVGLRAKRRDTVVRRLSSRVANFIRSRLLRDQTADTGCGLKVFPRAAFMAMPHFNHMHRFLPALMLRGGGRVISVDVNHRPRERGTSKYGVWNRLWVGIVDICGVMWLIRRPLRPHVEHLKRPGA
ncbi:MAG: glycosyltransferase family 2 protein [Rhodospirillales bacterium]|nr:glycosyltransferase family 2 protein [Rhodospirillales bacterium]